MLLEKIIMFMVWFIAASLVYLASAFWCKVSELWSSLCIYHTYFGCLHVFPYFLDGEIPQHHFSSCMPQAKQPNENMVVTKIKMIGKYFKREKIIWESGYTISNFQNSTEPIVNVIWIQLIRVHLLGHLMWNLKVNITSKSYMTFQRQFVPHR